MTKILVSAAPLREVLQALIRGGVEIRELMVLQRLPDSPIKQLVGEYEAGVQAPEPIDMVLFCPDGHTQHIDEPEDEIDMQCNTNLVPGVLWTNPPHRSHLCHACGYVWRPADVPTNGVAAVKTKGQKDTALAKGGA